MNHRKINLTLSILFIVGAILRLSSLILIFIVDSKQLGYLNGSIDYPEQLIDFTRNSIIMISVRVFSIILLTAGFVFYITNTKLDNPSKTVFIYILMPLFIITGMLEVSMIDDLYIKDGFHYLYNITSLIRIFAFITFLSFEIARLAKSSKIILLVSSSLYFLWLVMHWINWSAWNRLSAEGYEVASAIELLKNSILISSILILTYISYIVFGVVKLTEIDK